MEQLLHVLLDDIQPDPEQPRKDFNEIKLQELADSIISYGVIQAITIRHNPNPGVKYIIVAGERRWRASRIAGEKTIKAILDDSTQLREERRIRAIQLGENLNREDLNPVEKAEFINEMIELERNNGSDNPIKDVANELGVSLSWISKNTSILKYSAEVREVARLGQLRDYSILRKVEKLKGEKKQDAIIQIKSGQFNSKEFFSRKKVVSDITKDVDAVPTKYKLTFDVNGIVKLIDKTDFKYVLDRDFPDWRDSPKEKIREYIKNFTLWILDNS